MATAELFEIVLKVRDVEVAAAFYREVVGLEPIKGPDNGWASFWAGDKAANRWLGLRQGTLLYEEHSPLPPDRRFGPVHYALKVSLHERESALERLRSHGVTVYGPAEWEPGRFTGVSYYFYDTDNNLVEYWFPEPQRKPKAIGEIALKVRDLEQMQEFYQNAIGLELMRRFPRSAFFRVATGHAGHTQILALFRRDVDPSDGYHSTVDHIAFTIGLADFEPEKARLEALRRLSTIGCNGAHCTFATRKATT